jgi:hypothetical protein
MWVWQVVDATDTLFSVWMYRYMAALEGAINFGLCGLFLILLAALCIIAFSAVTVKYYVTS